MQNRNETRSSTKNFESEKTKLVAHKNAFNAAQYNHPDKCEAQIRRRQHQQVENPKYVTKINWQHKVKLSDDYKKYRADFINMLLKIRIYVGLTHAQS